MKKFQVKRYIETVNPEEVDIQDREYLDDVNKVIDMYGLEDMKKVASMIYEDDDSTDLFWIKKDENGYYVESFTCIQIEQVNEEEEIFELFKYKLIEVEEEVYTSAEDPEFNHHEFEDCLVIVKPI